MTSLEDTRCWEYLFIGLLLSLLLVSYDVSEPPETKYSPEPKQLIFSEQRPEPIIPLPSTGNLAEKVAVKAFLLLGS